MNAQFSYILLVSPLIFSIFCGCKDERVTQLETRLSKLEAKLTTLENAPKEVATPMPTPSPAPTAFPVAAVSNTTPVVEATYYLTGDEKDDPFIGKKEGEILMMAFFDYESQASRRFANVTLPELKKEFKDSKTRRLILRDYPLPSHNNGMNAAIYAQCAGEQGHYWEAFNKLTSGPLEELATNIEETPMGVNAQKLKKCRTSNRYPPEIEKDQRDGQGLGTQGSPSFFIGKCVRSTCRGQFIRGAQPLGLFRKILAETEAFEPSRK
jgi:protein-disulfide isomerase